MTGNSTEVFYRYDSYDDDAALATAENPDCVFDNDFARGRVTSISARGVKTWTAYDSVGRTPCVAKRLGTFPYPEQILANRYKGRVYTKTSTFDAENRPVEVSTGARSTALMGPVDGKSQVTTTYARSGAVKSVGGSYGTLVAKIERAADGPIQSIEYGDLLGTKTEFKHDDRRRVSTVQTYRGPPTNWTNADYTQQGLLQDLTYAYDEVDNPTEIRDWRIASEWPNGAKPVSRTMEYDDLYRVKRVDYRHHGVDGGGGDTWVNPHEADRAGSAEPRRSKPAGGVTFTHRMQSEQFSYDWLGNRTFHDDDRHGFWDRSPGPVTHGPTEHGNVKRYRASLASQAGPTGGYATIEYDAAGNTKQVLVNRDGPCANGGTDCNLMARVFCYDEVGQLDRVEHLVAGIGYQSLLTFAYDESGNRVRKSNVHPNMYPAYYDALYLFDSLELRGTKTTDDEYELTPKTEVAYLNANGVRLARLHYEDDAGVAAIAGESLHVLLQVPDHLGSTSLVIDKNSSELVEAGSYTASGAAETDHRPGRWKHFREDYRWTGKEDDLEAGIQYFGKRFFLPALGRWLTPDPLAVHSPGSADLNLYAYVSGQMLRATDPVGLAGQQADAKADAKDYMADKPPIPHTDLGNVEISAEPDYKTLRCTDKPADPELPNAPPDTTAWTDPRVGDPTGERLPPGGAAQVGKSLASNLGFNDDASNVAGGFVAVGALAATIAGGIRGPSLEKGPSQRSGSARRYSPANAGGLRPLRVSTRQRATPAPTPIRTTTRPEGTGPVPVHHLCTDKNDKSASSGGPWTPRFEAIFKKAGMDLQDPLNKVEVPGHRGPHPEAAHRLVFDRITRATLGANSQAEYAEALQESLRQLGKEAQTPGTKLNSLLTGQ